MIHDYSFTVYQITAHSREEQDHLHNSSTTWFTTTQLHPNTNDSFLEATAEEDEIFHAASLDDDIWLEDPVPDRHLCIHGQSQSHYQCSYICPYSLDLPPSALEDVPAPYHQMMDLSDIVKEQTVGSAPMYRYYMMMFSCNWVVDNSYSPSIVE